MRLPRKNNIDLTIMGAFSHTRLREMLLGSFTVKMLVNAKTSTAIKVMTTRGGF